ncbi:MAG: hypothetical protein HYU57_04775 [Micavibrio aeruginosavorus]|nr:hypothetical protein [Micavibrio aeruginosavorus]
MPPGQSLKLMNDFIRVSGSCHRETAIGVQMDRGLQCGIKIFKHSAQIIAEENPGAADHGAYKAEDNSRFNGGYAPGIGEPEIEFCRNLSKIQYIFHNSNIARFIISRQTLKTTA